LFGDLLKLLLFKKSSYLTGDFSTYAMIHLRKTGETDFELVRHTYVTFWSPVQFMDWRKL